MKDNDHVSYYDLDRKVLNLLQEKEKEIDDWQGAASGIADYVSSWGVERFWAMSRSSILKDGQSSTEEIEEEQDQTEQQEEKKKAVPRYYSWEVARVVLCTIIEEDLDIKAGLTTQEFQEKFRELNFNQQVLFTDLLLEIADTIQFWTMRIKDSKPKAV